MAARVGSDIVENGLVLALDAADKLSYPGSGTAWYDLSGNSNTGTLTNGPTFSAANMGSIVFDGTNDYVDCGNNSSLQITQGTISAWVKSTTNDSTFRGIIVKATNYGLFIKNGYLVTYDWGNVVERASTTSIIDGNWKNVAMTFTTNTGTPSNNAILYVNGVAVLTTTIKFSADDIQLLLGLGHPQSASQWLNGSIANSLVYNRVLTAAEILKNYTATKSRFGL